MSPTALRLSAGLVALAIVGGTVALMTSSFFDREPANETMAAFDLEATTAALVAAIEAPTAAGVVHQGEGEAVLTVFSAPNCPHCRSFAATVLEVVEVRPEVTVQVREVALSEPDLGAIAVIQALDEQGLYRAFYAAFAEIEGRFATAEARGLAARLGADLTALDAHLRNDHAREALAHNDRLANAIGLRATPTAILAGHKLTGAVDRDTLLAFIDEMAR
ncbi:MAG: DsbA family protein [Pseudomonadota bacterium]